jgi:hypothetical protein
MPPMGLGGNGIVSAVSMLVGAVMLQTVPLKVFLLSLALSALLDEPPYRSMPLPVKSSLISFLVSVFTRSR